MSNANFEKFETCLKYFFNFDAETFRKENESERKKNEILVSVIIKIWENVKISAKQILKSVDLIFENESIYSDRIKKSIKNYEKISRTSSLTKIEAYLCIIKGFFENILSQIFASNTIFFY